MQAYIEVRNNDGHKHGFLRDQHVDFSGKVDSHLIEDFDVDTVTGEDEAGWAYDTARAAVKAYNFAVNNHRTWNHCWYDLVPSDEGVVYLVTAHSWNTHYYVVVL